MCFSIKMEIKMMSHQFQKTATMNSQTTIGPSHFYQFYLRFVKGLYTINSLRICNQMTPYQRLQSGNKEWHSCKTSVIETTDTIDWHNWHNVVLLSMSKAFDSVNYETLILKLQDVRTSSRTLQWFRSYLSNRKQVVWIHSTLSDPLPVSSGVPQGSILGPLLFSIYTDDLASIPQKCSTQSYVDDMKLITSFQLKDNLDAITDLKDDLFKIGEWWSNNLCQVIWWRNKKAWPKNFHAVSHNHVRP